MNIVHFSAHEKSTDIARKANVNWFGWILHGGIALIAVLGFVYLLLLNSLATQGFKLQEIRMERSVIQQELESWDIALAIPSSLYALQSSPQVQQMSLIKGKKFVHVLSQGVAMR